MMDPTVIDDDGATYVALPCPHCDGDGVAFATLDEVFAGLARVVSRRLDEVSVPADVRLLDALAGMGAP